MNNSDVNLNSNLGEVVSDSSFLSSQLHDFSNNLNIGHLNCRSFKLDNNSHKIHEIRSILEGVNLDVVGISETWLKPDVSTKAIDISGYVCHRNDRPFMRGGGVAMYVSCSIAHKVVCV